MLFFSFEFSLDGGAILYLLVQIFFYALNELFTTYRISEQAYETQVVDPHNILIMILKALFVCYKLDSFFGMCTMLYNMLFFMMSFMLETIYLVSLQKIYEKIEEKNIYFYCLAGYLIFYYNYIFYHGK